MLVLEKNKIRNFHWSFWGNGKVRNVMFASKSQWEMNIYIFIYFSRVENEFVC